MFYIIFFIFCGTLYPHEESSYRNAVETLLCYEHTAQLAYLLCHNNKLPQTALETTPEKKALIASLALQCAQNNAHPDRVKEAAITLYETYTPHRDAHDDGHDYAMSSNALEELIRRGQEEQEKRHTVSHQDYLKQKRREKELKIKNKQHEREKRALAHNKARHEHMLLTTAKRERERRRQESKLLRQEKRLETKEQEAFKAELKRQEAERQAQEQEEAAQRDKLRDMLAKKS